MSPLMTVAELASVLTDPDVVVVDCRNDLLAPDEGRAAWQAGHIPNAIYLHVDDDLSGPRNGHNGRHPLPAPLWLAARLGSLGIGNNSRVVAYDASGGMYAARLWWLLGWLGHDNVQVLDGGFQAWQAAGKPISEERPVPLAAVFVPHVRAARVVSATQIMGNMRESAFQVVDARSPSRFKGEGETIDPVGGHIPGALNRFYADNLIDGRFKSPEQLQQEWRALLGAIPPADVVHQCGSGVTACHNLLAMAVAGFNGGRLYAGSWSEWVADPARPVATQ
ncbi:sulfurtransferase [Amantichitinum ursilacus]|uniref:3-mercaptopyruvate sulfurtransferase n=1 Tax=Amantichitinum ursilacus TaxID=857265 RepID=A0A0N0XIJ1_9NEIS|nr:sulfurtransferase [Amantichitinum ursilacus]KPC49776.1 3-mercaptopyruvate sulfurtransferase [Amantichitinum ursilacus]